MKKEYLREQDHLDINLFCKTLGRILSNERGTVVTVTAKPLKEGYSEKKEN